MSKTTASGRQAVVPSFPRLPLQPLGFNIAKNPPISRELFNRIDPKLTARVRRSGHHTSWEQSLSPRRGPGERMKQMKQERHLREVCVLQTELRLVIGPGVRKLI